MNEDLDTTLEIIKQTCPRCESEDRFERRGSHTHPYLRCRDCGFELQFYSKANRLSDLVVAVGLLGAMIAMLFFLLAVTFAKPEGIISPLFFA